jgi:(p)ppGpp synthase/HD superfamily hydrolase
MHEIRSVKQINRFGRHVVYRVEDTDATAADVETRFGEHIATGVSLLTDKPRAKRKERKAKTYAMFRVADCRRAR